MPVVAAGTAPLAYQWQCNGVDIPGATAAAYTVADAQVSDAGAYTVVVRNAAGSATSNPAAVTVNAPAVAPRYQFIAGNFTWTQAKADAEAKGGHLAPVTSEAEWSEAALQLGADMAKGMWLGAYQSPGAPSPTSRTRV